MIKTFDFVMATFGLAVAFPFWVLETFWRWNSLDLMARVSFLCGCFIVFRVAFKHLLRAARS